MISIKRAKQTCGSSSGGGSSSVVAKTPFGHTLKYYDWFDRADEDPLSTLQSGEDWAGVARLASGMVFASGGNEIDYVDVDVYDDQTAEWDAARRNTNNNHGLFTRHQKSAFSCYFVRPATTVLLAIYRVDAGTFTLLGSATVPTVGDPHSMCIRSNGNNHEAMVHNSVNVDVSVTDSTYPTGVPGLRCENGYWILNFFSGQQNG